MLRIINYEYSNVVCSAHCALTVHYDIQNFEILNDLGECKQAKLRKLCKTYVSDIRLFICFSM